MKFVEEGDLNNNKYQRALYVTQNTTRPGVVYNYHTGNSGPFEAPPTEAALPLPIPSYRHGRDERTRLLLR